MGPLRPLSPGRPGKPGKPENVTNNVSKNKKTAETKQSFTLSIPQPSTEAGQQQQQAVVVVVVNMQIQLEQTIQSSTMTTFTTLKCRHQRRAFEIRITLIKWYCATTKGSCHGERGDAGSPFDGSTAGLWCRGYRFCREEGDWKEKEGGREEERRRMDDICRGKPF
jgi:hypothetical protein